MNSSISSFIQIAKANSLEIVHQKAIDNICKFLFFHLKLQDLIVFLKTNDGGIIQNTAYGKKGNSQSTLVKNPISLELGQGITGTVAESKKELCIKDVTKCKEYVSDIISCVSELATPIIYKGKVVGVLDSEHSDYNFFNQTHIDYFQLASCMLSPIINDSSQKKNLTPFQRFEEFKSILIEKELFLQNNLNKKMVSNLLGLSSQYLAKIISQFSNKSFPEMVNELRVLKAKELLIDDSYSSCSLNELYYEVGFSSKSSFNRAFKKYTHLTPSEFRKFQS